MGSLLLLNRLKDRNYYYFWVGVFFLILISIVLSLYFSARQIDYTWRWYRIPKYFAYQEQTEIKSETDGEVESIPGSELQPLPVLQKHTWRKW